MAIAIPCAHLLKTVRPPTPTAFRPGPGIPRSLIGAGEVASKQGALAFGFVILLVPLPFPNTQTLYKWGISRFPLFSKHQSRGTLFADATENTRGGLCAHSPVVPWLPEFSERAWGDRAIPLSLCRWWLDRLPVCRCRRCLEAQKLRRSFWRRPFRRLSHARPGHNFGWKSLRRPRSAFHGCRCRRPYALFLGLHAAHGSLSSARHRCQQRCGFGLAGLLAGNMGLDLALTQ